jgi:hypothetical protein
MRLCQSGSWMPVASETALWLSLRIRAAVREAVDPGTRAVSALPALTPSVQVSSPAPHCRGATGRPPHTAW